MGAGLISRPLSNRLLDVGIPEALERARDRAATPDDACEADPAFLEALDQSLDYLGSDRAWADIGRDPYWPKWDNAWWHMTLLLELGLAERIPRRIAERMAASANDHFVHSFPFREEDVPAGADPYRNIVCHCALGTLVQVLQACGLDGDAELPWAREWILRYQLPDGGLNCDEEAYLRETPRSSMVSTLPPAEALLLCTERPFDERERAFLSGVASYLSKRSLVRSLSKQGRVIDPDWLTPLFPRFYYYDVLRGLRFLARWAERCGESVGEGSIAEVVGALDAWFSGAPSPREPQAQGTLAPDKKGEWSRRPSPSRFPLLDAAIPSGAAGERLAQEWLEVLEMLAVPGVVV